MRFGRKWGNRCLLKGQWDPTDTPWKIYGNLQPIAQSMKPTLWVPSENLSFGLLPKDFKFEKYIEAIQDRPLRIMMTKFRTSVHEPNIEKGRHKTMRREEKHCQTCKTKAVESEEHLLLERNLYSNYRN